MKCMDSVLLDLYLSHAKWLCFFLLQFCVSDYWPQLREVKLVLFFGLGMFVRVLETSVLRLLNDVVL